MTRDEILAMEAGRKLDALVEASLFNHQAEWRYCNWLPEGWHEVQSYYDPNLPSSEQYTGGLLDEDELHPCYWEAEKWVVVRFRSTDISATWQIEEKLKELGLTREYGQQLYTLTCMGSIIESDMFLLAHASPEVRCKAALLTKLEVR